MWRVWYSLHLCCFKRGNSVICFFLFFLFLFFYFIFLFGFHYKLASHASCCLSSSVDVGMAYIEFLSSHLSRHLLFRCEIFSHYLDFLYLFIHFFGCACMCLRVGLWHPHNFSLPAFIEAVKFYLLALASLIGLLISFLLKQNP